MQKIRVAVAALAASLASSGCYHYHIAGNRVTPATESRSATQVAYFWGLIQPDDVAPPNCPEKVALADVTSNTNLGYVLLGTVTLGIVLINDVAWRCAKDTKSANVVDVLSGPVAGGKD
jgi:hypothetical protein